MAFISVDGGGGQSSDKLARDLQTFQKACFLAAIAFVNRGPDIMHHAWIDTVLNTELSPRKVRQPPYGLSSLRYFHNIEPAPGCNVEPPMFMKNRGMSGLILSPRISLLSCFMLAAAGRGIGFRF
jgi:hypothetical protein